MAHIAAQLIVRNEGKHLMQCLRSIFPWVHHAFIGLAGESTDNTLEVIEQFKKEAPNWPVTTIEIEWKDDFAYARNIVFDAIRATGEYTHSLWLDGDDVLIHGEEIAQAIERFPDAAGLTCPYEYWRDDNGNPITTLIRNRVFDLRFDWKWFNSIHEVCLQQSGPHPTVMMDKMLIRHMGQEKERDWDRNFTMLQKAVLENNERSPVMLAYLAAEYAKRDMHETAIPVWDEAIRIASSDDERYLWMHSMADSFRALGQYDEASNVDFTCIQLVPDWPDGYYGLAENAFAQKDWKAVITWTEHGSRFGPPTTTLPINPLDYTYNPKVSLAIALANSGDVRQAIKVANEAYAISPNPTLAQVINQFKQSSRQEKVFDAFMLLQEHLRRNDEWLKVRELFKYAPKFLEQHPQVVEAYHEVLESTTHVEDPSIMAEFYINNPGWEPMPEETLDHEEWTRHPRVAYAIDTARRVGAETVLDIGCSDGFISIPLLNTNSSISKLDGLDLDPRCTALAEERATARGYGDRTTFTAGPFELIDDWSQCPDFYKYDLAIFFEAIEHVVDPKATLDVLDRAASHVAITTPYLAWEGDNNRDWRKIEPKSHLRIFDLQDIELLIQDRGRIHNLYQQEWDNTHSWIFADYEVGPRPEKTVQILCVPALEPWGPTKLKNEGLGGSETAVIRLAEELSADYGVTVYNNLDAPGYWNRVRYREIDSYAPSVKTDLSIAWRAPELADARPNTGCFVLWMHDTDAGDRLTPERASAFDYVVVLSEWHKQYFLSKYPFVPNHKLVVIGNGVDFTRFDWREQADHQRDSKKVVYSSSPDRGLDVILQHIWPRVVEKVPDATLHYYYGWNNFAALSHNPHLRQFKQKVLAWQEQTTGVVDHGRINQDELAREMQSASVWLYPTYFSETYCITAVEAQLAGLLPVTNNLAALSETVKSGVRFPAVLNQDVLGQYAEAVITALQNPPTEDERWDFVENAPAHSWAEIAGRWGETFLG